jgi:hypothetical protein
MHAPQGQPSKVTVCASLGTLEVCLLLSCPKQNTHATCSSRLALVLLQMAITWQPCLCSSHSGFLLSKRHHPYSAGCFLVHADGTLLAAGDTDGMVSAWDVPQGCLLSSAQVHEGYVSSCCWSSSSSICPAANLTSVNSSGSSGTGGNRRLARDLQLISCGYDGTLSILQVRRLHWIVQYLCGTWMRSTLVHVWCCQGVGFTASGCCNVPLPYGTTSITVLWAI